MVAGSLARMVPGGVAINRALGLMPHMPEWRGVGNLPGSLQKTYVGWNQPLPTGEVPVFKGDGTLVDYRRPSEVVAKAMGVDMGAWQEQGSLDNYLVKQREEMLSYRQEYLRAVAGNEFGKAAQIQGEFTQRFKGLPLTVTKDQVETFLQNRGMPRTDRILSRIPQEARSQYQAYANARGGPRTGGMGIPGAADPQRMQEQAKLAQEVQVQDLMRRVQQAGPATRPGGNQFQPFQGFVEQR